MKRILHIISFSLISISTLAVNNQLSDIAKVSLITCGAEKELYTLYGHSAIRINDKNKGLDVVFNYGLFSFSQPNFAYRFAKGKTDYMIGVQSFNLFRRAYVAENRSLFEQEINLTQQEKQKLFDFLLWNIEPENREYRYNFFNDNCATRIRDAIEMCISSKISYSTKAYAELSFRKLASECQQYAPLTDFGINIVLGTPADKIATNSEQMFLPYYLMNIYAKSTIERNGENLPLCKEVITLYEAENKNNISWLWLNYPHIIMCFIMLITLFVSIKQYNICKINYTLDYVLLITSGIIGIIVAWLVLFSEHPAVKENFNLLWASALNIIFAITLMYSKLRKYVNWYWLYAGLKIVLFLILSIFITQTFPVGIYFLAISILIRCALHLSLKKQL